MDPLAGMRKERREQRLRVVDHLQRDVQDRVAPVRVVQVKTPEREAEDRQLEVELLERREAALAQDVGGEEAAVAGELGAQHLDRDVRAERDVLGLHGLLPPHVGTLDSQIARRRRALEGMADDFHRYAFLRELQDSNEVLFHALVQHDLPRMLRIWRRALASGTPWEDEFRLRRADGAMRWHLSRALPLRDAGGRIVRWFGTNTDVDDRRRVEDELRQRAAYERQLIGIVSHDLRNPISAIIMAAQAIRAGDAGLIIAGGVESMSRAQYSIPKAEAGFTFGNLTFFRVALAEA